CDGHRDLPPRMARELRVGDVPDLQIRLGEVRLREQAAARPDGGPAEWRARLHLENLDHQRVAGTRALQPHPPGQRVRAERSPVDDVLVGRRGLVKAVGGVPGLEGNRVAGGDGEARRQGVVPLVVCLAAVEAMVHVRASSSRTRAGVNGTVRRRTPVASKTALAMAAGMGQVAGSPAPSGGLSLASMRTISTASGTSGKVRMG